MRPPPRHIPPEFRERVRAIVLRRVEKVEEHRLEIAPGGITMATALLVDCLAHHRKVDIGAKLTGMLVDNDEDFWSGEVMQ